MQLDSRDGIVLCCAEFVAGKTPWIRPLSTVSLLLCLKSKINF